MKVVIQYTGGKRGTHLSWRGKLLLFVAHPELCPTSEGCLHVRPDDFIPGNAHTWRDGLNSYNRLGANPDGLSRAVDLYKRDEYRELADAFGHENTLFFFRLNSQAVVFPSPRHLHTYVALSAPWRFVIRPVWRWLGATHREPT